MDCRAAETEKIDEWVAGHRGVGRLIRGGWAVGSRKIYLGWPGIGE